MPPVTEHVPRDSAFALQNESSIICWTCSHYEDNVRISFGTDTDDPSETFIHDGELCRRSVKRLSCLPYPFCAPQSIDHDLLLIPSRGTFLNDFNNRTGLHIGISSGSGTVVEYDRTGIKLSDVIQDDRWQQCLRLKFIENLMFEASIDDNHHLHSLWIKSIEVLISNKCEWNSQAYHSDHNNCFDFALNFINILLNFMDVAKLASNLSEIRNKTSDKIVFCRIFVLPQTQQAARYISLYRKLSQGVKCIGRKSL